MGLRGKVSVEILWGCGKISTWKEFKIIYSQFKTVFDIAESFHETFSNFENSQKKPEKALEVVKAHKML